MNYNPHTQKHFYISAIVILLVVTAAMFGSVLFSSDEIILSEKGMDISRQFIYWRDFGFGHLKSGNLPLWNPHLFSGTPFLGGFQSALLYPPNLIYLVLPLAKAINVSIALHVFLIGIFMYAWVAFRGLHPLACLLSSVLIMFCGTHFMHIYAGHITNLCAMVWVPLLLLSIDGLFEQRSMGWCLLGIFAVTMQIFAGHPQYVYYTTIVVFSYAALRLIKNEHKVPIIFGISGIYVGAFALGAIQILSGYHAASESVRSLGAPMKFASMFSFPPENFLTLFAPLIFGDMTELPYWGRFYLWEMSIFISITGLFLALYGLLYGERKKRLFSITMIFILAVLALGSYTPLFSILYHWFPGFDKFRGTAKFMFPASLFMVMLAGIGLDALFKRRHSTKKVAGFILGVGLLLGAVALLIYESLTFPDLTLMWQHMMQAIRASRQSYLPPQAYFDAGFTYQAAYCAAKNLFIASGFCIVLSMLFFLVNTSRKVVYLIVCLACIEIFTFANTSLKTFDPKSLLPPEITKFSVDHPGDYRVLNMIMPNSALTTGMKDIWGYDPGVLLRYAYFIAFTQGYDADQATQYIPFTQYHPLYKMLRCRYVFVSKKNSIIIHEYKDVMPRLHLIQDWKILTDYENIFAEMEKTSFDPRKTVILETNPDPEPVKTEKMGDCTIIDSSTDHLTIKASLPAPAILLITDAYSTGWRAQALPGSLQNMYHILPANYALMAIPLSAGDHLFKVEYLPLAFRIGKWISIVAVTIYFAILLFYWHKYRQKRSRRVIIATGNHKTY